MLDTFKFSKKKTKPLFFLKKTFFQVTIFSHILNLTFGIFSHLSRPFSISSSKAPMLQKKGENSRPSGGTVVIKPPPVGFLLPPPAAAQRKPRPKP